MYKQYPQHIRMTLLQDKCGMIDGFNIGDNIKVEFDIKGREYVPVNNKPIEYVNSLEVYNITKIK